MSKFWFQKDNGQIGISHLYLKNWFKSIGIYRHYIDEKQWILVLIKDRIIKEVEPCFPKNECLNYILNLDKEEEPDKFKVYEFLCLKANHYFGKEFYETLDSTKDIKGFYIMKDTSTHSFKYFKNCVVIIDKQGIKEIPHSELYGFIWAGQLINRTWVFGEKDTVFADFLKKISGDKDEKFNSFKSIIGYYLWTYKNPALLPCVVLTDEVVSSSACGRTGKGLFFKALSKIINVVSFDGKSFDFDKNFCFQRVNQETQLIVIDDVLKKFDFEKMFSLIAEGITIEKKNKPEMYIGFDDSPRFALTTNYALKGSTDSYIARLKEVELTKYFTAKWTPENEYKQLFFNSWDADEWRKFDNFMISCIIYFMKNGFIAASNEYYQYKKVLNTLGDDIFEWLEDCQRNYYYDKQELKNTIKKISDYKNLSSHKLKEMFELYCEYKGLELIEARPSNIRSIMFKEKSFIQDEPVTEQQKEVQTDMPF